MPWILLRSWSRQLASNVGWTWLGATLLVQLLDAFENLRSYLRAGATPQDIAVYFAARTPELALRVAPAAVLLGTLLVLFGWARRNELTAAEGAGLRPAWPYGIALAAAALVSGAHMAAEAAFLPAVRDWTATFEAKVLERSPLKAATPVRWLVDETAIWRVMPQADGVRVERLQYRDGRLQRDVRRLRRDEDAWQAGPATRYTYPPLHVTTDTTLTIPFLPEELGPDRRPLGHLPLATLQQRMRQKAAAGADASNLHKEIHRRAANALLTLAILLAAIPWVPRHGRTASSAVGVLVALALGLVGWTVAVIGATLADDTAHGAYYWLPHAVFVLTALGASANMRR